jgi:GntR family transcriptional repressor for pyruvate dehydrogenase complex
LYWPFCPVSAKGNVSGDLDREIIRSDTVMFSELRRTPLYQRVMQQIQHLIVTGELKPGDKLPSEAELCEQFGVSRTVIREATRSLVERGLLSAEPGRGTFVTEISCEDVWASFGLFVKASDISIKNLAEIRELLEVKIAELAAERATQEDIVKLEQAIEEMEQNIESVEAFIRSDLGFHVALAEATRNAMFLCLIGFVVEEIQDVRRTSALGLAQAKTAQNHHRAILKCVEARDGEGAADAMRHHLQHVMRSYESAKRDGPQGGSG